MVAKRTESHPPPFPVSSLDGPMDRQTHGQTDPWPYPPPPSITPMGCGATVGVLSPLTLWANPPHPPPPPPQQMCSNIWHRVCARGGGERGSPHAAPSPLLSNPPQRDQKGRTWRRDPFLARPPPCPPLPPGFPTTHTHASIPPAMCVPMQEAMRAWLTPWMPCGPSSPQHGCCIQTHCHTRKQA